MTWLRSIETRASSVGILERTLSGRYSIRATLIHRYCLASTDDLPRTLKTLAERIAGEGLR